jgi:hypothetical protein
MLQSTESIAVSLEDEDVFGPLVETPAPSPSPSPVKHDTPSRRARRARSTPSKSPRKTFPPRAQGARRAVPCAGCVRSAIAGRSTGECFDNKSGGDRCFRCASGHTCRALPSAAASACIKFVDARINNAPKNVSPADLLPQSHKLTRPHSASTYCALLPVLPWRKKTSLVQTSTQISRIGSLRSRRSRRMIRTVRMVVLVLVVA